MKKVEINVLPETFTVPYSQSLMPGVSMVQNIECPHFTCEISDLQNPQKASIFIDSRRDYSGMEELRSLIPNMAAMIKLYGKRAVEITVEEHLATPVIDVVVIVL